MRRAHLSCSREMPRPHSWFGECANEERSTGARRGAAGGSGGSLPGE